MALESYRAKRDFTATSEPKGRTRKGKAGSARFVIQKHAARRLHYDFRLEKDGVLLSWAVTRGPSLDPGEKRLAVHVEDHPVEYGDFEGTIPKGQYGGGAVVLWDRGTWKPIGDAEKGLAKGHLDFELDGEKLRGRWHLVRMAARRGEKRENWLLIKGDDAYARGPGDPDILDEAPASVKTGRDVAEVAAAEDAAGDTRKRAGARTAKPAAAKGAESAPFPGFVAPALATLRPEAPAGADWLHEVKFDGYRLQAHLRDGTARLLTRTGLDWTARFGAVVPEALGHLDAAEAILDGEMVVETARGVSDFGALQADLSGERTDRFRFYAFDLLYLDGLDLRASPLEARKKRLGRLLAEAGPALRYSDHFEEQGEMVLRHACRLSLEGIVSKRRDAPYVSGRGKSWIKSKCTERQEFVVAGYVPSTTLPKAIGALVLGTFDGEALRPAGRVGTGFTQRMAKDLHTRLALLARETPPFAAANAVSAADRREVSFVAPEMVVEVEFQNWTADGLLRHAAFRGIREDKPAAEVAREETGRAKAARAETAPRARARTPTKLTHPDRIYWSDAGVTKQGLAEYYTLVWPRMATFVIGRPLALLRCPGGIEKTCFFQKHAWKGQSRDILTAPDPMDEDGEAGEIVAIDGLDGLIGLVQGAALEIHAWQSTLVDLERPDQIVMDLDPGEGVDWPAIVAAAEAVRARLEAAGLAAFVKTSGGKGLHVVAPLAPAAGWDAVKGFAKAIADAMATDEPDAYVATVTKSKRRGRILVDYLRNGRGATAVAPYSTRARAGAPVAMPVGWDELAALGPAWFTVSNAAARLRALDEDPWEGFRAAAAPLPEPASPRRGRRR